MTQQSFNQTGLTLIELIITIAIIAIISSIALPSYNKQITKSRRSDGRIALQSIALAQERFFTINGHYTEAINDLDLHSTLSQNKSEAGYYQISIKLHSNNSYTLTATPAIDSAQSQDEFCTSITLTDLGIKGGNGKQCW